MTTRPQASVIVALNPHDNDPERVLDGYLRQTAQANSFEVVVVNGGARDTATQVFAEHRRAFPATPVRLVEIEGAGRAAAHNAGVRAAQSDLLVFVADDFIPSTTLVRAHTEFHRDLGGTTAVGIGPAYFVDGLRDDPFRCWLEDSGCLFGVPFGFAEPTWPTSFFYVGNASLMRPLFDRLGGFDETFHHDLVDDFDFGLRLNRAGVRSHFLPKAVAWHDHMLTLAERVEALRRSGEAARYVNERHGSIPQWQAIIGAPLGDLIASARRAEEREQSDSTPDTRAGRYKALLDLAFAQGYHGSAIKKAGRQKSPAAMSS
jgi:GT2 family glycosyltransferase